MGCVYSRVEEETVRRSRERKRLMKKLLSSRAELAAAHMAYLQALRNTGATLRQFTEAEFGVSVSSPPHIELPSSPPSPPPPPPPPPLPPSPPSPIQFSTSKGEMKAEGRRSNQDDDGDSSIGTQIIDDDIDSCMPPPLPVGSAAWDFWDPFEFLPGSNSSPLLQNKEEGVKQKAMADEENWAEAVTEFEDEEEEENESKMGMDVTLIPLKEKFPQVELVNDNFSTISQITRETDIAVVSWKSKQTLVGIVKEIDDYFLKAAAGGSDLLVLLESMHAQHLDKDFNSSKVKTTRSAKVLSWNWSLKSPQLNRGACAQNPQEACRIDNHRITLEKIYAEEVKLFKEVKEDELAKNHLKRLTSLIEKVEQTENDHTKFEKLQSDIEILQSQILSQQEAINATCLYISKLRDEELHPQLLELTFGLMCMWRTMHECHLAQKHISQRAKLLDNHPGMDPTSDSHCVATSQLENEVASWHTSFCNLLKSQREYVHVLNQWVKLTDCLPCSTDYLSSSTKGIHSLCEEWQLALDRLPDKLAGDAIKSLVLVVRSIILQQTEELSLKKKSRRLENRLERELNSANAAQASLNDGKLDALKKKGEEARAKYSSSVRVSRAMTLNNLHASLPNVFQALTVFSNEFFQALDGIYRPVEAQTGS